MLLTLVFISIMYYVRSLIGKYSIMIYDRVPINLNTTYA